MKKQNEHNAGRRSLLSRIIGRRKVYVADVSSRHVAPSPRAIIFQSEMDYISRCIQDYPRIETGGQLFGYYTRSGIPVVLYAIGPGEHADHEVAFFRQDIKYLIAVGRVLKEQYGLAHIGEWHSHHRLGLDQPSRRDVRSMVDGIHDSGQGAALLCIGNCNDRGTSLGAFLCDDWGCRLGEWDIIGCDSPVREPADRSLAGVLVHPVTAKARFMWPQHSQRREIPEYKPGYWLNKEGSGFVLNQINGYLKSRNPKAAVRTLLNEANEVVLLVEGDRFIEEVQLPEGFPEAAPHITRTCPGRVPRAVPAKSWDFHGDIFSAFTSFYDSI